MSAFGYDEENRLKSAAYQDPAVPSSSWRKATFTYDGLSRVRVRQDYVWMGTGWYPDTSVRYIYDGMNVVQEQTYQSGQMTPAVSYTLGLDLSASLQGAGGIGGMLARSHGYSAGTWPTHAYYHADGMGNIRYLADTNQAMVAKYKYDAYGRTISSSGTLAAANTYRFSSKEINPPTGIYYFGYRFYHPQLQRWVNRDPIEEAGFELVRRYKLPSQGDGWNLYAFVKNNAIGGLDPNGLKIWVCTVKTSGFPLYGYGMHAYLWDDRPGISPKDRECGKEGSSGSGGNSSGNVGPGPGATGNPWLGSGPKGDTECYQVPDSDGNESAVMACCFQNANKGFFFPYVNDCHNAVDDCLGANGLTSPPHSRGDPFSNHIKQLQINME